MATADTYPRLPAFPTLASLAADLRAGRLSSLALVRDSLQRIAEHDRVFHAFVEVYADEALAAARQADAERAAGQDRGPLHGIPVAVKDLLDIAGRVTTAGTPLLADNRAARDCALVERLRRAGAVIVGKTHLVQFALGSWGTNEHMGTPANPAGSPLRPLAPGGSSSGSVAAVAAHLVPWAIGTDTGGSVRVPAAFCGVVGFKPTIDALPRQGVYALSHSLDSVGFLTRHAEDAQLAFEVLAGQPAALPGAGAARPLRLGFLPESELAGTEADLAANYRHCLEQLRRAGHQLQPFAYPVPVADLKAPTLAIMITEGALENERFLRDGIAAIDSSVGPRLQAAQATLATDYLRAQATARAWQQAFAQALDAAGLDGLLSPVTQCAAPELQAVDHAVAPVHFTRPVNLLALCGISLPSGQDRRQRPIGLQLIGRHGGDTALLRAARRVEAALRPAGEPAPPPRPVAAVADEVLP